MWLKGLCLRKGWCGRRIELFLFKSHCIIQKRGKVREMEFLFHFSHYTVSQGCPLFLNWKLFLTYPMNTHITLFISKLTTLRKTATIYQRGTERLNNALKTTQLKTLELKLKVQHLSLNHFTKHLWDLKVCCSTPRYKALLERRERGGK